MLLNFFWVLALVSANGFIGINGFIGTEAPAKRLPYHKIMAAVNTSSVNTKPLTPKVYGVSLGGWLVLEPWITPSLFDQVQLNTGIMPVDEYTFSQILGRETASSTLKTHWNTFIQESDIEDIKNYGLNLVRIPIGYWAFGLLGNDPFVQGQEAYLDQAIDWCKKYDLKVQVDIHGMPGSQNGFDNSGRRTNNPFWLDTPQSVNLTNYVTDYVYQKYGHMDQVDSIEMVNEPFVYRIGADKIRNFYHQAYEARARNNATDVNLYFHDGFAPIETWNDFMVNGQYNNITMDHHIYEIFTNDQIKLSIDQHVSNILNLGEQMLQEPHESVVGEFSGALTDCTKYINGVGIGARYDGSIGDTEPVGSCANHEDYNSWPESAKEDTKRYLETQFQTYTQKTKGWIFWCYKTETTIEWDFRRATSYGLIPRLSTLAPETSVSLPSVSDDGVYGNFSFRFTYSDGGDRIVTKDHTISSVIVLFISFVFIYLTR